MIYAPYFLCLSTSMIISCVIRHINNSLNCFAFMHLLSLSLLPAHHHFFLPFITSSCPSSLLPALHHFFSHPTITPFPSPPSLLLSQAIFDIVSRQLYVENSVARSIILRPLLQEVTSVQRKMVRAYLKKTNTPMF